MNLIAGRDFFGREAFCEEDRALAASIFVSRTMFGPLGGAPDGVALGVLGLVVSFSTPALDSVADGTWGEAGRTTGEELMAEVAPCDAFLALRFCCFRELLEMPCSGELGSVSRIPYEGDSGTRTTRRAWRGYCQCLC